MAPILYMTPLSPPSRGVLLTAAALDLKLDLKEVDMMKSEHHNLDYLQLNPLHTVPTLVDGDTVITDSHAINAYLVRKYAQGDKLYPEDFTKRALVDQRLHFDTGILFNLFRNTSAPLFYRKTKEISQEAAGKVLEGYNLLETFLARDKWIAGNDLTIADFSLITTVTSLRLLVPIDPAQFPKTSAWIARFEELPYWKVNQPGLVQLQQVLEQCLAS